MPDSLDRRDEKFAKYDAMSTDELQQILRDDASKSEGVESDTEALFYVMEVLAKRRQARNEGKSPEEALESFKQNYYTENDISSVSESTTAAFKPSSRGRWRRGLIAAAAMLVIVIGSSITANAMGFDLWEVIAKWTKETFHFEYKEQISESNVPNPNFTHPCASLQEALDSYNITSPIIPTWIPEGFIEGEVRITQSPKHRSFVTNFQYEDQIIIMRIAEYLDGFPLQIEQSSSLLEVYTSNGVDYYIFDNYDILEVVWLNEQFECYISGPITVDEFKLIIDSIGKR